MTKLKDEPELISKIEKWTLTNYRSILNVIYWRVTHGNSINKIIKYLKVMVPNKLVDENGNKEYITKIQFTLNLLEKLK